MNIFTQLTEIDMKIEMMKEKKRQQQLFHLSNREPVGSHLFKSNETILQVSPLVEAPTPEKVAPLVSGFGPWGW